jgi:hypothetical protein
MRVGNLHFDLVVCQHVHLHHPPPPLDTHTHTRTHTPPTNTHSDNHLQQPGQLKPTKERNMAAGGVSLSWHRLFLYISQYRALVDPSSRNSCT